MKKPLILVRIALFSAILAILSQIAIPMPTGVPITLQTFAAALCGYCLKAKEGCASVVVYLMLGAVGVPVFSGFQGGFSRIVGPTGGFLIGFIFLTWLCGINFEKKPLRILFGMIGLILCHLTGALQYAVLMNIGFWQSLLSVSVPFLIKDIISVAAAFFASLAVSKVTSRYIL